MALIRYTVTETRTIDVAALTADEALALARQQEDKGWTIRKLDVNYVESAGWSNIPGNEADSTDNPWTRESSPEPPQE
jgi:hypothetical protein